MHFNDSMNTPSVKLTEITPKMTPIKNGPTSDLMREDFLPNVDNLLLKLSSQMESSISDNEIQKYKESIQNKLYITLPKEEANKIFETLGNLNKKEIAMMCAALILGSVLVVFGGPAGAAISASLGRLMAPAIYRIISTMLAREKTISFVIGATPGLSKLRDAAPNVNMAQLGWMTKEIIQMIPLPVVSEGLKRVGNTEFGR